MKKPVAQPTKTQSAANAAQRPPRAFAAPAEADVIASFDETPAPPELVASGKPRKSRLWRVVAAAGGILLSLALGLAAERLIRDLFARYDWLGWAGLVVLAVFVLALLFLAMREIGAVLRLRNLESLRHRAAEILVSDKAEDGKRLTDELQALYAGRPDMARPRAGLEADMQGLFDGSAMIDTAERNLMLPLDARARNLTAAAARRVAIVTAISPRALVDIAFVTWESFRLARAIAELYGARPGLFGSWRLMGEIVGHLAVTGGVALGDSVVQQLLGHGLAARLSARLGEGLVNGLMTVRVGIAAMRVTRPLPFTALKQPVVMDFMADLARINAGTEATRE